jgi:SNF2 family DNA or RNA helicase
LDIPEQGSQAFGKRSRIGTPVSTPGATTPGSSESPFADLTQESEGGSLFNSRYRHSSALQRQLQAEQNAARRTSQAHQDEEFARLLETSSSSSHPQPSSAFSQAVLNSDLTIRRPVAQSVRQRLQTPFHNPAAGPSNAMLSPFADLQPTLNDFGQSPSQYSSTTAGSPTPTRTNPRVKQETVSKVEPGLPISSVMRGNYPEIGIPISSGTFTASSQNLDASPTDSDSSDLVEITAEEFTPRVRDNGLHQRLGVQQMPQRISNPYQQLPHVEQPRSMMPMPGAWPGAVSAGHQYQQPSSTLGYNGYGGYGVGQPSNANTYGTNSYGLPSLPSLGGALSTVVDSIGALGSSISLEDRSYDHLDYLYADPKKSAEEIAKLLENIRPDEELPPHLREGTPDAMKTTLLEHQKLGLAWLKQQEESSNKGGILADDMGLGKTVQAIALMISRKSDDPARKTTLIIAPVALIRQWELEIQDKVKPGRHALTVYKHHGAAKKSFDHLRRYDVVITTFGSLAAELKKKGHWERVLANNPNALPTKKEELSLIGDHCKWYRVIIDEAQCIKNKDTQSAKAAYLLQTQYRLCMTGTPMMNNVTEFFSLIHFCQIRPFNSWTLFRQEIQNPIMKGRYERGRQNAMKKLQGIIRATMLRRTKESKIDGQPIIQLPPRETARTDVTFNKDEQEFYGALEQKAQLQFNKYLKAGTVMKNYANALVLLLRLRQACCHPNLIDHTDPSAPIELSPETMEKLAKGLAPQVVAMIRGAGGNFMCPICFDTAENPSIFLPCGHDTCTECFSRLTDPSQAIAAGSEGSTEAKCPECRGKVDPKKIIDFETFKKVHQPELLKEDEKPQEDDDDSEDADSDSEDEDEDESGDETSSLDGFIVYDEDDFEGDTKPEKKAKKKGKRKSKAKDDSKKSLAQLKREGMRNKKARRQYFQRLRTDFISSAKIDQTLALLKEIHERKPVEKVLIFSQFTTLLDLLEIPIRDEGYNYRVRKVKVRILICTAHACAL